MSPTGSTLSPEKLRELTPNERLAFLKSYLKNQNQTLHQQHLEGQSGLNNARARCEMLDHLITSLALTLHPDSAIPIALVASGGFGRGLMNPRSDLDLLFLLPVSVQKISLKTSEFIRDLQNLIWDLGFKFLPSTRSIPECLAEAKANTQSRTALFDARLITGDPQLFRQFQERFRTQAIERDKKQFFEERRRDLQTRHAKWSHTVFLQEPNLKESPGTLRDFHNLQWLADAELHTRSLDDLVNKRILTRSACQELQDAFDFLHRVRNALNYHDKGNDILTLRFQGILANEFGYPQKSILRRIEAFMRDYYTHARAVHNHTQSVFEIFELQYSEPLSHGLRSRLTFGLLKKKPTTLEHYTIRNGRLFPKNKTLFEEDPNRLIRLFSYCQQHDVSPSPTLRKLIKANWPQIDRSFRLRTENREAFREILERKGQVAHALRLMHRSGVLGRYLPEFGALDCLVQHEFFHRYTADEHTLRCIEELDHLIDDPEPRHDLYRNLYLKHPDPYALFIALLLHDTGRAENVREHIDGSAILAARVCSRLRITGGRRSLITFLVDHHLTLWRFATKKNIDDPQVIQEFADIMRNEHRLDALLLFTYADSKGTNEEAWSPWKESLILQLYRNTREVLLHGKSINPEKLESEITESLAEIRATLAEKLLPTFDEMTRLMPKRYFRYRSPKSISKHIATVHQYLQLRLAKPGPQFECAAQWIQHPKSGYSELILVTQDSKRLLEKICCALASHSLNILSADVYTRTDQITLDLFRVCTDDLTAPTDSAKLDAVIDTLYQIHQNPNHDPAPYLKKKVNILKPEKQQVVQFPIRAFISNDFDPHYTVIELQALDRIGLLHDVLHAINNHKLEVIHARICTEKGAALDSLYVSTKDGKKITDPTTIAQLERELQTLIA